VEILLNSLKNIKSVNVDNYDKVELSSKLSQILEYDIRNVLSATEMFDAEREANEIYRIYGKIEYLSLLNGLKSDYTLFSDFFKPQTTGNFKNILNSFDFYLVKPATSGYTNITGNTVDYIRYFEVIATPNQFEIFPVGFASNVYGEQEYSFNFNDDFDISSYLDGFGFPLTQLFLYAQYKPNITKGESMSATTWSAIDGTENKFLFPPVPLSIGEYVQSYFNIKIGDVIGYSKSQFYQTQEHPQTFYIKTPYNAGRLIWKYNPLIPFQLRYFSSEVYKANISGTSYEIVSSIPYYATSADTMGNYVWRKIMPQGYFNPLTGLGVDYPFVNKKRYLFLNIILDIIPDLEDAQTLAAFEELWYTKNAKKIAVNPTNDLNNIGKPCL
jgi:hypothetical protein